MMQRSNIELALAVFLLAALAGCGVDWFPAPGKFNNVSTAKLTNLSTAKFANHSTTAITANSIRTETTPVGSFVITQTRPGGLFTTVTSKGTFVTSQAMTVDVGTPVTFQATINTATKAVTAQTLIAGGQNVSVSSVLSLSP